jgi:DNA-binding MarR family transcriptional regulator
MPAFTAYRRAMHRVTPSQARGMLGPLAVLSRHPAGLRLSQVAEMLHLDLSVVSRHVAQTEDCGLVERQPDPDDRRAAILTLTDEGAEWIEDVKQRFAERVRCYLAGWTDDEVASLTDMLHRFATSMEAVNGQSDEALALVPLAPMPARQRPSDA